MEKGKETTVQKVSVVVCTYNGERYIREQIDSIIAQTYPIHEIILQDDGSTDGTFAILSDYANRYANITAWHNEAGKGISRNFFSAMRRATGDYIALSDQDDVWEKDKVESQIAALRHGGDEDKLLCFGRTVPFANGSGVEVRSDARVPNYTLVRLCFANPIPGHTMLFSRRMLDIVPHDDAYLAARTYDMVLAITAAAYGGVAYVDKKIVNQRRHADAATYAKPMDNRYTVGNMVRTVYQSFRLYFELKPELMRRAELNLRFLSAIKGGCSDLPKAKRMLKAQAKGTLWSTLWLSLFCLRHQSELFYVRERRCLRNNLRALLFPVYCTEYIRYMSKRDKLTH